MRAWRHRTVVLVGVALLAFGAASSASASSTAVPATQWTENFCGSILTWVTYINQRTASYNKAIAAWKVNGHGKISKIRGVVVAYVGDTTVSTDRMVQKVKTTGPPAVVNGAKTQAQVDAALAQVAVIFHRARAQANRLPRTNAVLFITKTQELSAQIKTGFEKIGAAFTAIGQNAAPGLTKAGRSSPACQKLG